MIRGFLKKTGNGFGVAPWWESHPTFEFAGNVFKLFISNQSGWPPARMTERSVELALADRWLADADASRVIEIGAVSPYYWPRRVACVVDPFDPHPLVTTRCSLFDVDLTGSSVLSISTIEHIGIGDYGLPIDHSLVDKAFQKIFAESASFLITVPTGYNEVMDDLLFGGRPIQDDIAVRYLVRSTLGNDWRQETDHARARLPYLRGVDKRRTWANCVVVISRGSFP